MNNPEKYMKMAYKLAERAAQQDEVPVGCVIVYQDKVIARGYNTRKNRESTIDHAEIVAIRKANKKIGSWRLEDCAIFVTLEPCSMCAGAIQQARIKEVYYGATDKKAGALGGLYNMYDVKGFNHYPEVHGGIMGEDCSKILSDFFRKLRNKPSN